MSLIIAAINEVISPGCRVVLGNVSAHAEVIEDDPGAALKKVKLSNLDKSIIVFSPDSGTIVKNGNKKVSTCMSPLLKLSTHSNKNDHHKACDAVVIRGTNNNECDILYIDLKSGKPAGVSAQFKSTRCFIIYLKEIIKTFHGSDFHIGSEKYIVFTLKSRPISKRTTRPEPNPVTSPDHPEIKVVTSGEMKNVNHLF